MIEKPVQLDRIVVAVDPPVTGHSGSDECGIVVAGVRMEGSPLNWEAVVLEDASIRGASPKGWDVVSNDGTPTGGITAGTVYVQNQGEFDKFHKDNYNSDPDPLISPTINTYNVNVIPGATPSSPDQYEILRDGNPLVPPVTGEVTDEPIEFAGMEIQLEGVAPGQLDFTLEKPSKENVLNTLEDLIISLNDEQLDEAQINQALSDGLIQLKNASEQIVFTQAGLGGRMNVVERVTDSNSALDINNQENRSSLIEIDAAEAISDLTKHESGLQASQATFGRLAKLSLFDYL